MTKATDEQIEKWIVEWYQDINVEQIYKRLRMKLISGWTRERIGETLRKHGIKINHRGVA